MQETAEEPHTEVMEISTQRSDEWDFNAAVQVRVGNPKGSDVALEKIYRANPTDEAGIKDPDHIHKTTRFFWDPRMHRRADRPFREIRHTWEPSVSLDDEDELLRTCEQEAKSLSANGILADLQDRKQMYSTKLTRDLDLETLGSLGNELGEQEAELFLAAIREFRDCHDVEIRRETCHPNIATELLGVVPGDSQETAEEYVWCFAAFYEITDQRTAIDLERQKENEKIWYLSEKPAI